MTGNAGGKLGLVTCADWPRLAEEEEDLPELLARRGTESEVVVWSDPLVRWSDFGSLVIRSAWDYHRRWSEFSEWLGLLDRLGIVVWNPTRTIRWNSAKSYLRDLQRIGIEIVPTLWVTREGEFDLREEMARRGWEDFVVKPSISASGERTERFQSSDCDSAARHLAELVATGEAMVQPFEPAVRTTGEWSFVYMGGTYSHAVRKIAGAGDFRVHEEHGGSTRADEPSAPARAEADRVASLLPTPWLFARIDGFVDPSTQRVTVSEVEMIEPHLYLTHAVGSLERFADSIARTTTGMRTDRRDTGNAIP